MRLKIRSLMYAEKKDLALNNPQILEVPWNQTWNMKSLLSIFDPQWGLFIWSPVPNLSYLSCFYHLFLTNYAQMNERRLIIAEKHGGIAEEGFHLYFLNLAVIKS